LFYSKHLNKDCIVLL